MGKSRFIARISPFSWFFTWVGGFFTLFVQLQSSGAGTVQYVKNGLSGAVLFFSLQSSGAGTLRKRVGCKYGRSQAGCTR